MEGTVQWRATGLESQRIGDEPVGVRFLYLPPKLEVWQSGQMRLLGKQESSNRHGGSNPSTSAKSRTVK